MADGFEAAAIPFRFELPKNLLFLKERFMFLILSKATLVILAGIYAMRSASPVFVRQPFQPLMIAAVFAFLLLVTLFYRAPTKPGLWLYTVILLCAVGMLTNATLYFRPDAMHSDPTNMAYSAFGMAGWGILLVYFASHIFGSTLLSK
jgi:hypothetical protein